MPTDNLLTPEQMKALVDSIPSLGKLKPPMMDGPVDMIPPPITDEQGLPFPDLPPMDDQNALPSPNQPSNKLAGGAMAGIGLGEALQNPMTQAALKGAALPLGMAGSTAMDPRWPDASAQFKAGNYPEAVNTGAQAVGKGLLMGQVADQPTTKLISQVIANTLGGAAEGVGQGVHSVGKVLTDTIGTVGRGVKDGVQNVFTSPEDVERRELVQKAMGLKSQVQEADRNSHLDQIAEQLKAEMASSQPDVQKIQTLANQLSSAKEDGGGFLDEVFDRGKNVVKGVGSALKQGNPLAIVGNTLNAVMGPETDSRGNQTKFTENPDSILGILKQGLGMSPLGPGGWDVVTQALGLGTLYPKQSYGSTGDSVPSSADGSERTDYFNPPKRVMPDFGNQTIQQINEKFNTDLIRLDMAEKQALAMARTGAEKLEIQSKIQALKKNAIDTHNAELAQAKSAKERANDYGIYVQGSDEKKYIDSISQGLKNFNAISGDLDSALTRGDYKTAQSTAEQLVQQMKKVTQQDVPNELKEQMIPLQQKFEGLLGMFKGQVINPRNVPVIWESLKGVHDELETALTSFFERPGANVPLEIQEFLRGNTIEQSAKTSTYAPAIEAPPAFAHTLEGNKLAIGFIRDGSNVAIDAKGAPHILDKNNKPTDLIAMTDREGKPSLPAKWDGNRLVREDGTSVGDDIFAHYALHQAPINPSKRDAFGFPEVDKKQSVKVSVVSPSSDTFEMLHSKWTNPDFANNNIPYWTSAQEELGNRAAGDTAVETEQKGKIMAEQIPATVKAVKDILKNAGGAAMPSKQEPATNPGTRVKTPKGY
jgi:hypothetical protein